jgi:hypothetical protein
VVDAAPSRDRQLPQPRPAAGQQVQVFFSSIGGSGLIRCALPAQCFVDARDQRVVHRTEQRRTGGSQRDQVLVGDRPGGHLVDGLGHPFTERRDRDRTRQRGEPGHPFLTEPGEAGNQRLVEPGDQS